MHRTQIYLDRDLNVALDRLARRRGTSKANLLRLAARRLLDEEQGGGEEDPILGIFGLGSSGFGNTSVEHDRVLAEYALGSRQP